MSVHYHTGWSLPGCLPEMEPATFADELDATAFVVENENEVSAAYDCDCKLAPEVEHDPDCDYTDPYTYWVEPCSEADCVVES